MVDVGCQHPVPQPAVPSRVHAHPHRVPAVPRAADPHLEHPMHRAPSRHRLDHRAEHTRRVPAARLHHQPNAQMHRSVQRLWRAVLETVSDCFRRRSRNSRKYTNVNSSGICFVVGCKTFFQLATDVRSVGEKCRECLCG